MPLNRLRYHVDRPARAFRGAQTAALAIVVVELEPLAGAELDHRVVRTHAVAIVALEAIAAGQAATRLIVVARCRCKSCRADNHEPFFDSIDP